MGQSFSSNASWGSGDIGWTGQGWTCTQCQQQVYGSHICQTPVWAPNTATPTFSVSSDALVLKEILELVRELHSVIFRQRVENDMLREKCEDCEHCGQ